MWLNTTYNSTTSAAAGPVPIADIQSGRHTTCTTKPGSVDGTLEVTFTVQFGNVWYFSPTEEKVTPPKP